MSQAEALLSSLADAQDETEEKVLVVDNSLRTISIPKSIPNLGVEYDDEVLRLPFRLPRYLDDLDLSEFKIRINYSNARGGGDTYEVDDAEVVGDNIEFTWLVGHVATAFKGSTKFNVCLKIVNEEGVTQKEFNTTPAILPVLEGLETGEQIVYEYADVLTKWYNQLIGAGDSSIAKIEETYQARNNALVNVGITQQNNLSVKGKEAQSLIDTDRRNALADIESKRLASLNSIPDEYDEVVNKTEECYRRKAEAVVMSASGDLITLDDSSDMNLFGLKVYGKTDQVTTTGVQLFDASVGVDTVYGTSTVKDNGATVIITGEYYVAFPISLPTGPSYYVNYTASPSTAYSGVRFLYDDGTLTDIINQPAAFNPSKPITHMYLYCGLGTAGTTTYTNVQVNEGTTPLPWEPYSGGYASPSPDWPQPLNSVENARVNICGGNLFNFDGITEHTGIVRNSDGSITCSTYACSTGLLLKELAPNLIVGKEYKLTIITDGPQYIYLGLVQQTWTTENRKVVTQEMLDSSIYIYGKEGNLPALIERIWITPTGNNIPYEQYITPQLLTVEHTIHGIPVDQNGNYTDANGQQWICDEIDFERGKFIQRVKELVFDGTQPYILNSYRLGLGQYVFCYYDNATMPQDSDINYKVLCDKMPWYTWGSFNDYGPGAYCLAGFVGVHLYDPNITTVDQFKAYVTDNPIKFLYQLANPIETGLTEAELVSFKALKTHATNSVVTSDSGATMVVKYGADIKTWLPKSTEITLHTSRWIQSGSQTHYYQVVEYQARSNTTVSVEIKTPERITLLNNGISVFLNNDKGLVTAYAVKGKPSSNLSATLIEQRTERV